MVQFLLKVCALGLEPPSRRVSVSLTHASSPHSRSEALTVGGGSCALLATTAAIAAVCCRRQRLSVRYCCASFSCPRHVARNSAPAEAAKLQQAVVALLCCQRSPSPVQPLRVRRSFGPTRARLRSGLWGARCGGAPAVAVPSTRSVGCSSHHERSAAVVESRFELCRSYSVSSGSGVQTRGGGRCVLRLPASACDALLFHTTTPAARSFRRSSLSSQQSPHARTPRPAAGLRQHQLAAARAAPCACWPRSVDASTVDGMHGAHQARRPWQLVLLR